MPYVVITVALPILAIIFQNYPLRNMYTAIQGLVAFAFIIIGAWIATAGNDIPKVGKQIRGHRGRRGSISDSDRLPE